MKSPTIFDHASMTSVSRRRSRNPRRCISFGTSSAGDCHCSAHEWICSDLAFKSELKGKELALSLKAFQLEFTKRTYRNQFSQLYVSCFAQRARLAQRTSQFFQPKDQIHFASHQSFF